MFHPSIGAQEDGQLGLLWEGVTKKWLFATAKNAVLTGAPVEVLDEGKGPGETIKLHSSDIPSGFML
jgi:hypothetical protein